jgi:hypothetical protein
MSTCLLFEAGAWHWCQFPIGIVETKSSYVCFDGDFTTSLSDAFFSLVSVPENGSH